MNELCLISDFLIWFFSRTKFFSEHVYFVYECEWRKTKKELEEEITSPFSPFYYDQWITEEKILDAVKNNNFFGFLNVTMRPSEKTRKKFDAVNFPPLFKKMQPKKCDLSQKMRYFFDKDPAKQLTVGYDADQMTLSSNLVKFYLDEGFIIKEVHWALEYQKG